MDKTFVVLLVLLLLSLIGFGIYLRGVKAKTPTENEPAPPPSPPIPIPLPVPVPVPPVEPIPPTPPGPVPPTPPGPVPPTPPGPVPPTPPVPPPKIDTTERLDTTTELLMKTKDTNGVLAVPNLESPQKGLNFKQIITGTVIPVTEQTDMYPLVIQKSDLASIALDYTNSITDRRAIKTIENYKLYERPGPPIFYNISHIEVLPIYPAYKKYHYNDFFGNWFDQASGTGFFMPVGVTFMAYNAVHMLKLIGIGNDKIFSYASSAFQKQVGNATGVEKILNMTYQEYVDGKYNYINNETRPMKYLTWMALQKGYKTIQLGYEFDGTFVRRYFVDCLDPNISNRKLVRRNPFSILPNPESRHWYYNMYLVPNGITVDNTLIKDVGSNRTFYEILPFQRECRLAGGIINIYNKYLQCLKIVKFGLAPEILMTEGTVDLSKYPKATELEKLQSYYSIVYGDDERWKSQTLEQLRWRWDAGEIVYNALVTGLGITTPFATKRARTQVYHQDFGPNSTVKPNPTITCKRINYKNSEQLKYIEVFRQGTRSSTTEDNPNFAGTYYYSIRGSGYFLPTGKMFYSKRKNDFFTSVGLPSLTEPAWEQDKPISSACISKGVDVFNVSNFVNTNNEVIHNVDIITSLSSLVRMSPFDERVSQVNDNLFSDPYVKFTPTGESVKRQFDYTIDYSYP